jgi:hypothetical protein
MYMRALPLEAARERTDRQVHSIHPVPGAPDHRTGQSIRVDDPEMPQWLRVTAVALTTTARRTRDQRVEA